MLKSTVLHPIILETAILSRERGTAQRSRLGQTYHETTARTRTLVCIPLITTTWTFHEIPLSTCEPRYCHNNAALLSNTVHNVPCLRTRRIGCQESSPPISLTFSYPLPTHFIEVAPVLHHPFKLNEHCSITLKNRDKL